MGSPSPIDTIDHSDAGPDTMGRYRYQATFAAIVSLDLLNDQLKIQEMYHEHHEDVFVLQNNGKYVLYQVKTRLPKYSPLKFDDPSIYSAVKKFVRFEKKNPDACEKFVLVTNCPFYTTSPTSKNLEYCIELSKKGGTTDTSSYSGPMKKIVSEFGGDSDLVLKTLRKVELFPAAPLDSLNLQLKEKIWPHLGVAMVSKEKLDRICDRLVEKMNKSGANMYDERSDSSLRYGDTEKNIDLEIISKKKITPDLVESIIQLGAQREPSLLRYMEPVIENTDGHNALFCKLKKANLSEENTELLVNLTYSAELYLAQLLHKYDVDKARGHREHLRLVTQNTCQTIYDSFSDKKGMGLPMLNSVREKLEQRYNSDIRYRYDDLDIEHFIGISGILTNDCLLWWSEKFNLEECDEFI